MDLFFPEQTNDDVCSTWKSLQIKKKKRNMVDRLWMLQMSNCQLVKKSNVWSLQSRESGSLFNYFTPNPLWQNPYYLQKQFQFLLSSPNPITSQRLLTIFIILIPNIHLLISLQQPIRASSFFLSEGPHRSRRCVGAGFADYRNRNVILFTDLRKNADDILKKDVLFSSCSDSTKQFPVKT